ncbi:MAG: DUF6320 domain-containing protein [Candidatus Izemoplasmatales bacterium]|nr:DUF6320 domain-containing protein [Candidatus Izemoplasmatales bacterium]
MKHCDKCKITINTHNNYCPLCQQVLEGETDSKVIEKYPEYVSLNREVYPLTKKILMFFTFVSIIILAIINLASYDGKLWSLVPIGSIVFFWILMSVGVFSRHNIAFKFATITLLLIGLLILIDVMAENSGWSYNYLMPFLLSSCNLAISTTILVRRIDYRDYILYLLTILILSLIPIALVFGNIIDITWPSITSFALAITILFFIIFFFPKSIKDEIKKRFHA